jgi:hypothetical protein
MIYIMIFVKNFIHYLENLHIVMNNNYNIVYNIIENMFMEMITNRIVLDNFILNMIKNIKIFVKNKKNIKMSKINFMFLKNNINIYYCIILYNFLGKII